MKRYLSGLITGVALTTLVGSLIIGASAISSKMTIEVDPINIRVNGETFQPKDEHGNEVPVFAYGGTTYAPLRALAKAYGLEVGYDKEANMASVTDPDAESVATTAPDTTAKADYSDWSAEDEAAYQEFKGMWKYDPSIRDDGYDILIVTYNGDADCTGLVYQLKEKYDESVLLKFGLRIYDEISDRKYQNEHLNFKWGNRIIFAVYPEQKIGYGSAWSAGH